VNLMIELPKIAMRELKNSHMVPARLKEKLDTLKIVYTTAWITRDFKDWCQEHREDKFEYPITEYLKVVDERYAGIPEEKQPDMRDPRIVDLMSLSYELTGLAAPRKPIATLLLEYSVEDIGGALREYVGLQTEKDLKAAMRAFYVEGSAAAVILARRRRNNAH
jgi:hypothetical protein